MMRHPMPGELFIASYNAVTKRHAVLEDDGLTAWLYLHRASDDPKRTGPVEKACFVYNRKPPIRAADANDYRPSPPPIARGYASDRAVCPQPGIHVWTIHWSDAGEAVLLKRDGEPWCVIETNKTVKHGYSKSISKEGPWGSPWDQKLFGKIAWI